MAGEEVETPLSATPASETKETPSPPRRRKRHIGRWLARIVLALLFIGGFYLSVFPSGRATLRTLLLLPRVLAAAQPAPFTLGDGAIAHTQQIIPSSNGPVYLDVYAPTGAPAPIPGTREGLVVIPGVGDNRTDPQLINFSESLAHTGIVVMDMTTPALIDYRLSVQDGDAVVAAYETLARWPGVGANHIGLIGFSAGEALACFAAADARIRDRVAFIASFGGYFNTLDLLRDTGMRALIVDGHKQVWQPQLVPLQVLSRTIATLLPVYDGAQLENAFIPGATPLTQYDLSQLSPETVAAYHLLAGDQPGRVEENINTLSPPVRAMLAELSPSRVIGEIAAPIYLLHDRNDQYVPFTESRAFAAALTHLHHVYDLAEFGIFEHTEVKSGQGLGQLAGDGLNLMRILIKVVQIGS